MTNWHLRLIAMVINVGLTTAPAFAGQKGRSARPGPSGSPPAAAQPLGAPTEAQPAARVIQYSERDVPQVRTRLRYTTLIVLPKEEIILDFLCGDKDLWVINGDQNFAYVKPAKENAQTNLNLITASGNVYSFVLSEGTATPGVAPDLKVFVQLADAAMTQAASAPRRFVSAREAEDWREQAQLAKDEARQIKEKAQTAVEQGISRFVTNVRFSYQFEAGKKPFYVRAMYHDDKFTYIQARPEETPTLYELKDEKPNLVSFDYKDGVYVVDKILDSGYLAVGKKRLKFSREE